MILTSLEKNEMWLESVCTLNHFKKLCFRSNTDKHREQFRCILLYMFIVNVGLYKEQEFVRSKHHQTFKKKSCTRLGKDENFEIHLYSSSICLTFEENTSFKRMSH